MDLSTKLYYSRSTSKLPKETYIPSADNDKISSWAKESVANMKQHGLISGVGNNMYAPLDTANRASVVQVFKNFIVATVQ